LESSEYIKPALKLPDSNILEAYHQSRNQIRISYCRPTRHTLGISPSFTGRTQYHDDASSSRSSWLVILDLGDLRLIENEVRVVDTPFLRAFDNFFISTDRTEELQAFLNIHGHDLTLPETGAFLQMAREHAQALAVYYQAIFDDKHSDHLVDRPRANNKLIVTYHEIYESFLKYWEQWDPHYPC